eukprot:c5433_g1_i1 orf=294-2711(-)
MPVEGDGRGCPLGSPQMRARHRLLPPIIGFAHEFYHLKIGVSQFANLAAEKTVFQSRNWDYCCSPSCFLLRRLSVESLGCWEANLSSGVEEGGGVKLSLKWVAARNAFGDHGLGRFHNYCGPVFANRYDSIPLHICTPSIRCPSALRGFHRPAKARGRPRPAESEALPRKPKKIRPPPADAPYRPSVSLSANSTPMPKTVEISEGLTVKQLAERIGQSLDSVQAVLANLGEPASSPAEVVNIDAVELVAMEFGHNVKRVLSVTSKSGVKEGQNQGAISTKLMARPAVITVMGHVDHGKTSLLDALRQTSVAAKEAGGITQHIGAFVVSMSSGASLTFLDTPGHAAFSAMRARGAAITDIVVLVVAADDGVMPQTLEALAHAQAANVPIVVAINKCDKSNANPAKVHQQLLAQGVELEEIGGDVQVVEISATEKQGLDKLEEALLLQADLMNLQASIDGDTHAVVVEASIDRGKGPVATVIVRSGSLIPGLNIVVGTEWGRIRSMHDTWGQQVRSAGPSKPVEIEGLKGLPQAGDELIVVANEEIARKLSQGRKRRMHEERLWKLNPKPTVVSEENEDEKTKVVELVFILKADVQGTVEAVSEALRSLNSPQVVVTIVHAAVGPVSQSDLDLAQACGACIVGFNVRNMAALVESAARCAKIDVRHHRVIYHLLEDIGQLIISKAPGVLEPHIAGQAEVLNIFEIKGKGSEKRGAARIAGCRVVDGRLMRSCGLKVLRSGELLFEGSFESLRREKLDVDAVGKGNECGLIVKDWEDFQIGDVIQCIELVTRKPRFVSSESGAVKIEC